MRLDCDVSWYVNVLQDKIEELEASLEAVRAECMALSEQNPATEKELQVSAKALTALFAGQLVALCGHHAQVSFLSALSVGRLRAWCNPILDSLNSRDGLRACCRCGRAWWRNPIVISIDTVSWQVQGSVQPCP